MMRARLRTIRWEAEAINSYELEPLAGEHFPPFTAGAHIDIKLPIGLARSYSLSNDPSDTDRYEVAVQHAIEGRGGSKHIHESFRVGDILDISEPKNNFPLDESAAHSILIAGGIGVTPVLSMIARLNALGKSWQAYYVSRNRERAAYVDRLEAIDGVKIIFDEDGSGEKLDMASVINSAAADTHIYCCGPTGMLDAFAALSKGRPAGTSHMEYFTADTEIATDGGYTLELRKSGKNVTVSEGETMLDALLGAGVDVGFACAEGVCGTCAVGVLEGIPDHRDHFLTDDEKASNTKIMVCCSGSKSPNLVLDI